MADEVTPAGAALGAAGAAADELRLPEMTSRFETTFYDALYTFPLYETLWFNNYGFSPVSEPADAAEPYQAELYRQVLGCPPLAKLMGAGNTPLVLEVGCGQGGGLRMLADRLPAGHVIGVDACAVAVERTARRLAEAVGEDAAPRVVCAPSTSLPFPDGAFDAALMVESSGCFSDEQASLLEANRVLRDDGVLVICGYRRISGEDTRADLLRRLSNAALAVTHFRNITANVVESCHADAERRVALIEQGVPEANQSDARHFAALPGSTQLHELETGGVEYFLMATRKQSAVMPPCPPSPGDSGGESGGESGDDNEEEDPSLPPLPSYYDWTEVAPYLADFAAAWPAIREEAMAIAEPGWTPWPERHYASEEDDWRVVPFCYTFPANEPENMRWVNRVCEICPRTAEALRAIPTLRTALFSRLGPGTTISAHRGWASLANHVLRVHLPLLVPGDGTQCGLWVDGETTYLQERELVVFDDSKLHKAFNLTEEERLVLIIDIARPEGVPLGRATGGRTKELDDIIARFAEESS